MSMSLKVNFTVICIVAALLVGGGMFVQDVLKGPRSSIMGFDSAKHDAYTQVGIGDPKDKVIELLGDPLQMGEMFLLPQRKGFEEYFEEAEVSDSTEYYLWKNKSNWFYCIGFDKDGKVIVKGEGSS